MTTIELAQMVVPPEGMKPVPFPLQSLRSHPPVAQSAHVSQRRRAEGRARGKIYFGRSEGAPDHEGAQWFSRLRARLRPSSASGRALRKSKHPDRDIGTPLTDLGYEVVEIRMVVFDIIEPGLTCHPACTHRRSGVRRKWLGHVKPLKCFGEDEGGVFYRRPFRRRREFSSELAVPVKHDPGSSCRDIKRANQAPPSSPGDSQVVLGVLVAGGHRSKFARGLSGLLAFIQPLENAVTIQSSQDLHNRGWGFALVIILLAIAANVTAFSIHKATYLQPSDNAHAPKAAAH